MPRRTRLLLLVLVVPATLAASAPGRAAEVTRVASGAGDSSRPGLVVSLAWLHESRSSAIRRELQSSLTGPGVTTTRDLRFFQSRDVLAMRAEVGALWDFSLHVEAPFVLADNRRLDFDRDGDCISATGAPATCDSSSSTLLRDGILPGYGQSSYGLDAKSGGQPFSAPSRTVFRGPSRSGLEYLGAGLTWAILRQDRYPGRPTWLLSFDTRWSVAGAMRFDPDAPGANTSVGLGYHQLVWSTWLSRRIRSVEPYFGAWYMLPVRSSAGLFKTYELGSAPKIAPQQRLGISFGLEHVAWEEPARQHRLTLELRGRGELLMRGRNYSELWEPLSGASGCSTDQSKCRAGLDEAFPGASSRSPFPGVTEVEGYASFGADAGVNLQIGRHVRFRGLAGMTLVQSHLITDAGAGRDLDGDGRVSSSGAEANPTYRPSIDQPGRRFKVDESHAWNLLLDVAVLY